MEEENNNKRYCNKCKEMVETWDDSYDYDDGWFTRTVIKCRICNNILYQGTQQY